MVTTGSFDEEVVAAPRVEIDRVVVPLDASADAERGLAVADWLRGALGAAVELVHVETHDRGADPRLEELAAAHHATATTLSAEDHPADALAGHVLVEPRTLVCIATHGHDRSSALIGSVPSRLVDLVHEPVLLVGPEAVTHEPPIGAPVVVAVGGQSTDRDLVHLASRWAAALGRPLVLVTVVEPAPSTLRGDQLPARAHGPADPDACLVDLQTATSEGAPSRTVVIEDPIGVADGLVTWLRDADAAAIVVGSHHRNGLGRLLHGSTAARVAHGAACPVLVTELDWRR